MAIKTPIEATGVSKYKSDMRSAATAVKTLGAELRQCEAEYKATGDQAAYLAQKSDLLEKQIQEQQRAVATAEKGLEAMKRQYGENSTQVMEWRTKLAQAKTQLANMQTELQKTTSALNAMGQSDVDDLSGDLRDVQEEAKKTEGATDDLGESVGGIAKKLDRQSMLDGLEAISNKMLGVIRTAGQMGKAIWEASTDAASWADATLDASKAADMSVEEYQRVRYAAQFYGLTIDDLVGKQGKLTKAMDESGRIMVGDWAIDTIDRVTGQKRAFSNVMLDIVEGLNLIEDPVARDQEAMRIFGKSYAEMRGLMDDADSWQSRINEAPIVSEASVNSLAETAAEIKTMNSELEALKMEVLAALAPDIKLIAQAVGDLARNLSAFLQTEKGQQLLRQLGESIASVITSLTEKDFSGVVNIATKAIEGLIGVFDWIDKHKDEVAGAIQAIGLAMVGLRIAALGVASVNFLSSMKNLLGLAPPAATPATTPTATPTTANLSSAAGVIGSGMVPFVTMVYDGIDTDTVARMHSTNPAELMNFGFDAGSYQADLVYRANRALSHKEGGFLGIGAHHNQAMIWQQVERFQQAGLEAILDPSLFDELMRAKPSTATPDLLSRVTTAVALTDPDVFAANVQLAEDAGLDMAEGEAEGIMDGAEAVNAAAEEAMGKGPVNRVKTILQMHSPSLVMAGLGLNAALGFAEGINEGAKAAIDAASSMAGAVSAIVSSAMMSLSAAIAATSAGVAGGRGGAAGGFYDGSTTVNIGTYNQNSSGDQYALAGLVASAQKHERQGYGRRV